VVVAVVGLTRGPILAVAVGRQLVVSSGTGAVGIVRAGVAAAAHEL